MRDINQIIDAVEANRPTVNMQQLKVHHAGADDDGLWFFWKDDGDVEIQIESSDGMCPFLVETSENATRLTTNSIEETVEAIYRLLHLHNR
ncbi:MAG TPA: hypothetical protein VMB47_06280 [Candidatus Aquilonibacter sp.]|nr:hypothetical protein [Candidatus Aquilonibacter sp.]